MKKVFITGGSGTVGSTFIEKYLGIYKFYSYSRNEKMQVALKRRFPEVEIILGAVDDKLAVLTSIAKIKPDIIIHAAALKHVDNAEFSVIHAIKSNVIGSLNIIEAAVINLVPITIAISTDKACSADSNYGYTKALMEKMFLEAHNDTTIFNVCRFGNVSHSHGSVISYWLELNANKKPLPLTHASMNRLMFSRYEAAELINSAIDKSRNDDKPFILSQKMKSVNMFKLAETISNNIVSVGLRPGEKLDEILISKKELCYTFVEGKHITIREYKNDGENTLKNEYSSKNAEFMSHDEIISIITDGDEILKEFLLKERVYRTA